MLREIYGQDAVQYVRNITDIDDKIIETAKKNNISINELTNKVTKDFHSDCNFLNCLTPSVEPKATDHIKEMIELTKKLLELDFAYIVQGHVYFEVSKFDSYGKLSNKKITDLVAGARVEISDLKKTQLILFFGNHRQQKNLAGIHHGAGVGQDGILSVRRWLKNI